VKGKPKNSVLSRILRWFIPLAISGAAFWFVLRDINFSELGTNLAKISLKTYVFASLAYFASFFFRAFCWYILLRRKVSFKDAFFTMAAGYLLNNLFPFRLGELGRAVLLSDPDRLPAFEVLSSIVVERVFDVFLAAIFLLMMLPRILSADYDQTLILIALALTLIGLTILFVVARFRVQIMGWMSGWGERYDFIKKWLNPKVAQVLEGLSVLNHPSSFFLAFGSLTISWFLAFGKNYFVFRSLYPSPPFWWMIFVLSAGAFGAALPSAPAGLGVFEGVMVAAFALLGVDAELAFTHAIVVHVLAFSYANILGLIGLKLRGEAIITLYHRVINRAPEVQTIE
jgi:glycosyltransferase 2 family protein